MDHCSQYYQLKPVLPCKVSNIKVNGKKLLQSEEMIDKSSDRVAKIVNKTWLSRYPWCQKLIYDNGSEFKLHFDHICDSYGIKRSQPRLRAHKQMLYWNAYTKSSGRCYTHLKLIWPIPFPLMMSMSSLTMHHGPFTVHTIQCPKRFCSLGCRYFNQRFRCRGGAWMLRKSQNVIYELF
jgi:hypothetical protein